MFEVCSKLFARPKEATLTCMHFVCRAATADGWDPLRSSLLLNLRRSNTLVPPQTQVKPTKHVRTRPRVPPSFVACLSLSLYNHQSCFIHGYQICFTEKKCLLLVANVNGLTKKGLCSMMKH